MRLIGIWCCEAGREEHASLERDSGRAIRERRMTIRTPAADLTVPQGRPAFMQGKFPGATSPKGPSVQARAVFGGVAPAPLVLRPRCASRPGRIANRMTDKALPRPRLLRAVRKPCCAGAPRMLRRGVFPAAPGNGRSNRPTTAPFGGKGHPDGGSGQRGTDVQSRPDKRSSPRSSEQCSCADSIPNIAA